MKNYRVECFDPRDNIISSFYVIKADLFIVDDDHVTVTFYSEENGDNGSMTPVAMFPFKDVVSVTIYDDTEE